MDEGVMITEDYVSYEVAKLLKEKRFNEDCRDSYDWKGNFHLNTSSNNGSIKKIAAPTIQTAMKWLREIHNLHVDIDPSEGDWKPNIIELENWSCVDNGEISICNTYEQACEAAIKYCLEKII